MPDSKKVVEGAQNAKSVYDIVSDLSGMKEAEKAIGDACNKYLDDPTPENKAKISEAHEAWAKKLGESTGSAMNNAIPGGLGKLVDLTGSNPLGDLIEGLRQRQQAGDQKAKAIEDLLDSQQDRLMGGMDRAMCNKAGQYFRQSKEWVAAPNLDPLAIDLDGDGIETVGVKSSLMFDHDGDGIKNGTGWVGSDDGFLALDRNGNGSIDTGAELFGVNTVLPSGQTAAGGFEALSAMDSNGDGRINSSDTGFQDLRVWRDLDQNGTSTADELFSLSSLGIAQISLTKTTVNADAGNGNQIEATGTFTRTDGSTGTTAALGLIQDHYVTEFAQPVALSSEVLGLPQMSGMGSLRSLREAAELNTNLRSVLSLFADATTVAQQRSYLTQILVEWAATGSSQSPGVDYFLTALYSHTDLDTGAVENSAAMIAKVRVMEKFFGEPFAPPGTSEYWLFPAQVMLSSIAFDELKNAVYEKLVTQTLLKPYIDAIAETATGLDYSAVIARAQQRIADLPANGLSEVLYLYRNYGMLFKATGWDVDEYLGNALAGAAIPPTSHLAFLLEQMKIRVGTNSANTLQNDEDHTTLFGGGGNDTLTATVEGALIGGAGNDVLHGSVGSDLLSGGTGDDTIDDFGYGTNNLRGEAGNDTIHFSSQANNTIEGGAGNDVMTIVAVQGGQTGTAAQFNNLVGGTGNDQIQSGAGADNYVYYRGDGQDVIFDNGYTLAGFTAGSDSIKFGPGIVAANLAMSRSATNLIVKILDPNNPTATDQIIIQGWFASQDNRIEAFTFDDGTNMTESQITALGNLIYGTAVADSINGTSDDGRILALGGNDTITDLDGSYTIDGGLGNDTITDQGSGTNLLLGGDGKDTITFSHGASNTVEGGIGDDLLKISSGEYASASQANVLIGGAGIDRMQSGASADTYLFNRGDGKDTIVDSSYQANGEEAGLDAIQFGAGISLSDLAMSRVGSHLLVKVLDPANPTATDQITIESWFTDTQNRIESFVFANGSSLTETQITQMGNVIYGTEAANTLSGSYDDGMILGLGGNDTITDLDGSDTIEGGAGNDIITDQGSGSNLLRGNDGKDTITFSNEASNVVEGGAGDDLLKVMSGEYSTSSQLNTLAGGTGVDRMESGASADTYLLNRGDGKDRILDNDYQANSQLAGLDSVQFGSNIAAEQLWFRQLGSNLEVSIIGTSDSLTIENWYLDPAYRIEELRTLTGLHLQQTQVQNLVQAMASFAPPAAGQTTLPTSYQSTLLPVIAANWQ